MPDVDVIGALHRGVARRARGHGPVTAGTGRGTARARARRRRRARADLDDRARSARCEEEEGFDARERRGLPRHLGRLGAGRAARLRGRRRRALRHQQGIPAPADPDISWDYDRDSGGAVPPRPGLGIGSPAAAARGRPAPAPGAADGGLLRGAAPRPRDAASRCSRMVEVVSAPLPERWLAGRAEHWIVAMDYAAGSRVVFGRDGAPPATLADAVIASCAIPGWYAPVVDRRPAVRRRRHAVADLARPAGRRRARRGRTCSPRWPRSRTTGRGRRWRGPSGAGGGW